MPYPWEEEVPLKKRRRISTTRPSLVEDKEKAAREMARTSLEPLPTSGPTTFGRPLGSAPIDQRRKPVGEPRAPTLMSNEPMGVDTAGAARFGWNPQGVTPKVAAPQFPNRGPSKGGGVHGPEGASAADKEFWRAAAMGRMRGLGGGSLLSGGTISLESSIANRIGREREAIEKLEQQKRDQQLAVLRLKMAEADIMEYDAEMVEIFENEGFNAAMAWFANKAAGVGEEGVRTARAEAGEFPSPPDPIAPPEYEPSPAEVAAFIGDLAMEIGASIDIVAVIVGALREGKSERQTREDLERRGHEESEIDRVIDAMRAYLATVGARQNSGPAGVGDVTDEGGRLGGGR